MRAEFLLAILLTTQGVIGDVLLKQAVYASDPRRIILIILASLVYGFAAPGWYSIMRIVNLGIAGAGISALTIVALSAIGYFAFGETFNARQICGVIFAILAVSFFAYS